MDMSESDTDLLAQYIASFEKLGDLRSDSVPAPSALRVGTDASGWEKWQPRQVLTPSSALEALYRGSGLPGIGSTRFPPLYETLILSYRWAEVDLGEYRLLANEPAEDLSPLLAAMQRDQHLRATLLPNGYIQFGRGADIDYDPVCFDFRQRQKNGDCRIVKLDHEAILCDGRIGTTTELAPNFRSLVLSTIQKATSRQKRTCCHETTTSFKPTLSHTDCPAAHGGPRRVARHA